MKKIIFLFLISISCFHYSRAQQWNSAGGFNNWVSSFAIFNGELYAVGSFITNTESDSLYGIAKWNGNNWMPVGNIKYAYSSALCVYNNKLYAGGASSYYLPRWDGTKWDSVYNGIWGNIYSLAVYNNELYAGGVFDSAGGVLVNNIARWNDTVWKDVGGGVLFSLWLSLTGVYTLSVYNNELIIGGTFNSLDPYGIHGPSIDIDNIAKWDGNTWYTSGLKGGIHCASNSGVQAFGSFKNKLYAGGEFGCVNDSNGVFYVNKIVRWDGAQWDSVDGGMNSNMNGMMVKSFAVMNNELYAGGSFDTAGGKQVNHIAKWNDTVWSDVGGGTNGSVFAMIEYDSSLFIGGGFTIAGTTPVNNVARWGMPTGMKEINNMQLAVEVYPNPTTAQLNIRIEKNKSAVIELYDIAGKKLLQQNISSQSSINIPFLSSGIYFYKITDKEKKTARGKIVIE